MSANGKVELVFGGISTLLLAVALLLPSELETLAVASGSFGIFFVGGTRLRGRARRRDQEARRLTEGFTEGSSVEVDCRLCGQFNRVPAGRLRDRPICGRCKTRLMPGRRVVCCRASQYGEPFRSDLNALWEDEDRLWERLADHLAERDMHAERPSRPSAARQVN